MLHHRAFPVFLRRGELRERQREREREKEKEKERIRSDDVNEPASSFCTHVQRYIGLFGSMPGLFCYICKGSFGILPSCRIPSNDENEPTSLFIAILHVISHVWRHTGLFACLRAPCL